MILNARFRDRHRDTFSLHAGGRDVGQLTADAIRFHGFASAEAAREAAQAAVEALADWGRRRGESLRAEPRLLTPTNAAGDGGGHGFELDIPAALWTATRLGLAQRLYTALLGEPVATP